jgi:hypothetical protein
MLIWTHLGLRLYFLHFLLSGISFCTLQIFCDCGKGDNAFKSIQIIYEVDLAYASRLGDTVVCVFSDSRIKIVC